VPDYDCSTCRGGNLGFSSWTLNSSNTVAWSPWWNGTDPWRSTLPLESWNRDRNFWKKSCGLPLEVVLGIWQITGNRFQQVRLCHHTLEIAVLVHDEGHVDRCAFE
jgi:hypothetical protein